MKPIAKDGELVLYASDDRTMGKIYNEFTGKFGDEKPLQVFFKWGNWEELDYDHELEE